MIALKPSGPLCHHCGRGMEEHSEYPTRAQGGRGCPTVAEPPDPCDMGALIRAAVEASGMPRADIVRAIAAAEGRTWDSVSVGLSKAMGRPDAGAEVLRAVCVATGRRVTTEAVRDAGGEARE